MAKLDFLFYKDGNSKNHKNLVKEQINDNCFEFIENLQDVLKMELK